MNILMVHNFYQIGGGEHTVYKNEIELLKEKGQTVFTYTRDNNELKHSLYKKLLLPFTTVFSLKSFFEVRRIISENNINIVHCHNTFPLISPSVYYAALSKHVPVVQTIHNFRFLCPDGLFYCKGKICELCREKNSFISALKNKCYRNSFFQTLVVVLMLRVHRMLGTYKRINYIFLTDFNKEKFSKLVDINRDNIFVKPNFVKNNLNNRDLIKEMPKNFVFAGRLEKSKGIEQLIENWKKMPSNYILSIYGDGSLKERIQKATEESNNIIYKGFQPNSVVLNELKKSYSLIFPSLWYEGFPMIIAESFSVGCPVIATNIGNQSDIIRESRAGVCFDPNSGEDFINAVRQAVNNNDDFSLNAKNYYSTRLSKDSNYLMAEKIYQKIQRGDR